ncbi:hypothetical protein CEXT_616711 [Caerostris extrusa]|uniref:Uncharacterized protein n=1 Tax=Caerostris extrusa TaxID=172846 RepID=A0AAV4SU40_CAEEX|nr:hypothetical protein CEXT_616711 [Caerostris extrusa]
MDCVILVICGDRVILVVRLDRDTLGSCNNCDSHGLCNSCDMRRSCDTCGMRGSCDACDTHGSCDTCDKIMFLDSSSDHFFIPLKLRKFFSVAPVIPVYGFIYHVEKYASRFKNFTLSFSVSRNSRAENYAAGVTICRKNKPSNGSKE